jgi:hypothetical protein
MRTWSRASTSFTWRGIISGMVLSQVPGEKDQMYMSDLDEMPETEN